MQVTDEPLHLGKEERLRQIIIFSEIVSVVHSSAKWSCLRVESGNPSTARQQVLGRFQDN